MNFRTYPPASPDHDFIVPLEVRADHRVLLAAFVVLALTCPSLPAAAADPEILVVGDSWARQIYDDRALEAALDFAGHPEIGVLGEPTPAQINTTAMLLHDRYEAIAATRPRVVSVPHWGLMQRIFGYSSHGIDPGELALPSDSSLPSPPEAMRNLGADCFHLKPAGYEDISERLWQEALAWSFDGAFASGFESGDTKIWSVTIP